jgi:hypothetical protein
MQLVGLLEARSSQHVKPAASYVHRYMIVISTRTTTVTTFTLTLRENGHGQARPV